jgi:hypothetical protein
MKTIESIPLGVLVTNAFTKEFCFANKILHKKIHTDDLNNLQEKLKDFKLKDCHNIRDFNQSQKESLESLDMSVELEDPQENLSLFDYLRMNFQRSSTSNDLIFKRKTPNKKYL